MTITPENLINGTASITSESDIFDFKDAQKDIFY